MKTPASTTPTAAGSLLPPQPRFVPTLTEVVQQPSQATGGMAAAQQEHLVQRVLQRIDLSLERRLREVVGQVVLEHTQTLAPRLREEIEAAVRQSVAQAFAQEEESQGSPNPLRVNTERPL